MEINSVNITSINGLNFVFIILRQGRGVPDSSYNIFPPNFSTYHLPSWNPSFSWQIEEFLLVPICSMLISAPALLGCGKAATRAQLKVTLPHPGRTGGLKSANPAPAFSCPFDLVIASVQAAWPRASAHCIPMQIFIE